MTSGTYNAMALILLGGSLIALLVAVAYLVAAIVGWRGPHRWRRLVRCAIFLAAFPVLIGAQQVLQHHVFLPSLAARQRQQVQSRVRTVSLAHEGDLAPTFRVRCTDGREFDLAKQRGKVVLINFFATWCGPCRLELPRLQGLWERNRDNSNFAMIVIGREETSDAVSEFQSHQGYAFPMAADPQGAAYGLYAQELIPRTYLVSGDGKISFSTTGFSEPELERLEREVERQLRAVK